MSTRTVLIVTVVSLLAVSSLAVAGAAAQDQPESASDYLNELNDLRESEALGEYTELDLARSQAVVELQTNDGFDEATEAQMHHLLSAILAFERAYELADGEPIESVDHADEARHHLEELGDAGGEQYAGFGTVALERFYALQGERLYEQAQGVESTPERLALLDAATRAFDGAGEANRFADTQLERDELRAQYDADMQRHDELVADSRSYLDGCEAACEGTTDYLISSPWAGVGEYTTAMQAHENAAEAAAIAAEHGLEEGESDAAALESRAFTAMIATGAASGLLAFFYAGLLFALASGVIWRLSVWAGDVHTSELDTIVTPLEADNG